MPCIIDECMMLSLRSDPAFRNDCDYPESRSIRTSQTRAFHSETRPKEKKAQISLDAISCGCSIVLLALGDAAFFMNSSASSYSLSG
jgi:hypothetical protein